LSLLAEDLLNSLAERMEIGKKEITLQLLCQCFLDVYHLHRAHVGHGVYFLQLVEDLDDRRDFPNASTPRCDESAHNLLINLAFCFQAVQFKRKDHQVVVDVMSQSSNSLLQRSCGCYFLSLPFPG
jgi:hypothetical protein